MRVHTDWLLTPERAAVHLPTATAVVADLHLGYDLARHRLGDAVPSTGLDDTTAALSPLLRSRFVRRLLIAGDAVENQSGAELFALLMKWLASAGLEWIGLVPGNHDRSLGEIDSLSCVPDGLTLGSWQICHGDRRPQGGLQMMGHFHPCLRLRGRMSAPCYLVGRSRIIIPAFSQDAAGVNVLGRAFSRGCRCFAIVQDRVLDFGNVSRLSTRFQKSTRRRV